jgi:hypothetical protein
MVKERGRRREHHNDISKGSRDLRSLRVLRNFLLRMRTPNGTPKGIKWPSVTYGSHVTTVLLLRKTRGEKRGMRRTYFRSGHFWTGPLPVTWLSHFRSKGPLGRILRHFLLRMRRTYFRTGHVTSGHVTFGHAQWSDPPHDPPQIRLELYPYTTSTTSIIYHGLSEHNITPTDLGVLRTERRQQLSVNWSI